jgi:hypothetical protein
MTLARGGPRELDRARGDVKAKKRKRISLPYSTRAYACRDWYS